MRRLTLLLVTAMLAVSAAPAAAKRAGWALTRPRAALRLEGLRRVWMWADYWSCQPMPSGVVGASGTTTIPLQGGELVCSWVRSHWATVPSAWRCQLVQLTGPVYLVTVCGPAL